MNDSKLVGIAEIGQLLGVSKQAVVNWRKRYEDFPKPIRELESGPIWEFRPVEEWRKKNQGNPTHRISFINLKGGVGKTTTAVAVAEVLAKEHNLSVLLVDLDPQTNATVNLIKESVWKKMDDEGATLAQLFEDHINYKQQPKFDIEKAIVRGVSNVHGGIPKLDLLPSSVKLIELQDELPLIAARGNYETRPVEILSKALEPILDRYAYVIIDCPPSLGPITKNGLRISTSYVIPTIPDIISTWGVYQIVEKVKEFSKPYNISIHPLGIVATKVQSNGLHDAYLNILERGQLFDGKSTSAKQPPLFKNQIKQTVNVARGANSEQDLRTLKLKYGSDYDAFQGLTKEIIERCNTPN
ncbi:MAG TPA: AAA family ATPase [Verrucomicrobiae bacterium]|jgi:chromosome partitioning protein|nr:AAA family ATPase [Verrucomicrobiae bacterium]